MIKNDSEPCREIKSSPNQHYIPLTNSNEKILCSEEDYVPLKQFSWYKSGEYVKMTSSDWRLHRYVMIELMKKDVPRGMVVDHINRNKFDNRRENLRIIQSSQNSQNRSKSNKASSKFHGVCVVKKTGNFRARITDKGKVISIGTFSTELEAAAAYDLYIAHHPERGTSTELCHPMNFPEKIEQYIETKRENTKIKTSNYKGVYLSQSNFYASIWHNGKKINILKSKSESECANAYDRYIVTNKLNKKLNFPEKYPNFFPEKSVLTKSINVDENTVSLILTNMPEKSALIDLEDYNKLKFHKCFESCNRVCIHIDGQTKLLHRVIMNIKNPDIYIDHINNNSFDNRKCNLRLSNAKLNSENKKKMQDTSSKYFGVSKKRNRWQCQRRKNSLCLIRQHRRKCSTKT